ncbi:MAG: phosphoadenosine phosphosulfate reductase family protein [Anaerolineales bacterium]|nr:phosphoadenosine phosphosulfate reductase family protein [Anaerolineales bacterium]
MRCRRCDSKAVINMRQHKLSLCAEHFIAWFQDHVARTIERHHMFSKDDRLLLAVSGGKDSLVLWDILIHLGYNTDGLYINLGINEEISYSDQSAEKCFRYAEKNHLFLHQVNIPQKYGLSIPDAAKKSYRSKNRTCALCGLTKRHVFNEIATKYQYDVLLTGHNLDDEASVLFGNTVNWLGKYLARQSPVLEASSSGFTKKAKPLCRAYERETTAYAIIKGISYFEQECPFAAGATTLSNKVLLNDIEAETPGFKQRFYLSFLKAKEEGLFDPSLSDRNTDFQPCSRCGQPTSNPEVCNFCRTWENILVSRDS